MRNLRKNQKRGGLQYTANVYNCGTKVKVTECIRNFAAANNFTVVQTLDDGNCFYDTLSKYGNRSENVRLNKGHMDLRREIIGTMIANKAEYAPYFVKDETVSPEGNAIEVNVDKELHKFLRSGQWVGWMGDVIPQVAADILGVNIVIYDVRPSNVIDRITIHPVAGAAATTVNMLRTNGSHFRLLWPAAAAVIPASAPSVTAKKPRVAKSTPNVTAKNSHAKKFNNNIEKAIAASLASVKIEAEKAPTLRPRPVVAPGSNASRNTAKKANAVKKIANVLKETRLNNTRKRSSSLENALEAIAEQKRAETLAIKRKEASIKAAAMKAEAAKIVAAKKAEEAVKKAAKKADATVAVPRKGPVVAPIGLRRSSSLENALKAIENANAKAKKTEESNNEASNNEKEALAFQRILEESMMKFKIKNNKNK